VAALKGKSGAAGRGSGQGVFQQGRIGCAPPRKKNCLGFDFFGPVPPFFQIYSK